LSWIAGPQGLIRPEPPSMKELKRAERRQASTLRSPDEV
jgi:NADH-quinone oxidoreductase subunit B